MKTWTKEIVLEELIHAFEVDDALPVRVGPMAYGSSMPDYIREASDRFAAGGRAAEIEKREKQARDERMARRARIGAAEVSRAERAMAWVPATIGLAERRQVLFAYAMVKARGWDWSRYVEARNRRHPTKNAWVRRTTYRWIWQACQAIADALDNSGVLLPEERDGQVSHETAEIALEPIRSGSSAWMAPDGRPTADNDHPDRAALIRRLEEQRRKRKRQTTVSSQRLG